MKTKIKIKSWFTGKILFEFETDNNTIRKTLEKAVKDGANLDGANLSGANLSGANLSGATLDGANLSGANLSGANLYGANLYGATLDGANLDGANLSGANLYSANLYGAKIKKAIVYRLYRYITIAYLTKEGEKRIKMGCYDRTFQAWEADFWNNNNEFPNNGSEKSNLRLLAFETAKKWFEIVK